MTPQEKSLELYSKYEFVYIQNYTSSHEVKECALIAVDEVIEALKITTGHCQLRLIDYQECLKDFYYWQQVKEEIEKL